MATDRQLTRHGLLVEVNEEIRALGGRIEHTERLDWQFWCECGDDRCSEALYRSLQGYDELRDRGLALLAEGHVMRRARAARASSSALRSDARALRGQASHQRNRARRFRSGNF